MPPVTPTPPEATAARRKLVKPVSPAPEPKKAVENGQAKPKKEAPTPAPKKAPAERPLSRGGNPVPGPVPKAEGGLKKAQVSILRVLANTDKPLTRSEIAETAKVDVSYCTTWIGSTKDDVRAKNDEACLSLITLKYVKTETSAENGDGRSRTVYSVTAAGRKALEKAGKSKR